MDTAREERDQPRTSEARRRPGRVDWAHHRALRARAVGWGALAGALVVGVYVGTLAVANSLEHLREELLRLWPWMAPLVVGFSTQVGLFAYARSGLRGEGSTPRAHGVVASGGASTASMVACCAHHLTDVLPLVGLAGAATLLATYQNAFLLLGVLSNLVGLVYVLGLLRKNRLYPARPSLLSVALRWPVDRALGPVVVCAVVVLAAVLWGELATSP